MVLNLWQKFVLTALVLLALLWLRTTYGALAPGDPGARPFRKFC